MTMSSAGGTDGARGGKSGRHGPKSNARRSKIERVGEEQAESSRQRQRQREAATVTSQAIARGNHGRSRGNGGFRGGMSGWKDEGRATGFLGEVASNPTEILDTVPESEIVTRKQSQARQDPIAKSARGDKKKSENSTAETPSETRMKGKASEASNEDSDGEMADSNFMERRKGLNVDDLAYNNLISDDEERYDNDGNERKALYPDRLKRKPHTERKTTINTTASSKQAKQTRREATAEGVSVSDKQQINANQSIKTEEDIKPTLSAGRSSTRTKSSRTGAYVELSDDDVPSTLPQRSKNRKKREPLFSKPILQTPEDYEEWDRRVADRKALAEELGNDDRNIPSYNMSNGAALKQKKSNSRREDKVYLFQMPPDMPNLRSPSDIALNEPLGRTSTTELHSQTTSGRDKGKAPARLQDSTQGTTVKVEEDARGIEGHTSSTPELSFNASSTTNFKGPIGTLTVYESGDTELDWGGIEFQLERGFGTMLQETLLVDDNLNVASSMSQVVGTFIMKPNWDLLLDAEEQLA